MKIDLQTSADHSNGIRENYASESYNQPNNNITNTTNHDNNQNDDSFVSGTLEYGIENVTENDKKS